MLRGWRFLLCILVGMGIVASLPANSVRAQEGQLLNYGDQIEANITASAYRHVFYFRARRGDVVSLEMLPLSGNLDPILLLANNNGQVLAKSDDAKSELGASIPTIQILEDDYYFIIATRFGHELGVTEGRFELQLQRVGVSSEAGVYLSYGDAVLGSIDDEMFQVKYIFEAQQGDIINVSMQRIAGSNLDSYVYIMDADGQVLIANDDGSGSLDAAIEGFLILDPGLYTIVATRFGEEAGTSKGGYVLTLDTAPISGQGLTPDAALLLRYGEAAENTIDDEHPQRFYTFGAQRGDVVTVRLDHVSGGLDPFLMLINEERIVLAEDDDSGQGKNALIQSFIIPETGTYYVMASRFEREAGGTSGAYTIQLEGVTGEAPVVAPGTQTILYGSTVSGTITNDVSTVTYAFLANAGDVVTIAMTRTSGDLDPLLLLFTANSVELTQDDDSGPQNDARIAAYEITEDGTYYIIATRFEFQGGETTGDFSLSLVRQ